MTRSHPVRIVVVLLASDYRAYVRAAQILARIMGANAPMVAFLIQAQLVGRDATGVADDYLDSIGWPRAKGRVISLRHSRLKSPTVPPRPRRSLIVPSHDPSRN